MRFIIVILFLSFSLSGFSQNSKEKEKEIQKERIAAKHSNMIVQNVSKLLIQISTPSSQAYIQKDAIEQIQAKEGIINFQFIKENMVEIVYTNLLNEDNIKELLTLNGISVVLMKRPIQYTTYIKNKK